MQNAVLKARKNWWAGRKRWSLSFAGTKRPVGENDWAIDRLWEMLNWMEDGGPVARRILDVVELDAEVGDKAREASGHNTYTGELLRVLRNGRYGDAKLLLEYLLRIPKVDDSTSRKMITVAEAAKRMRCSEQWIEALCENEWGPKGFAKIVPEGGNNDS